MFIKYPYKIQIYRITSFGSIYFRYVGMIAENEVWTKTPDLKGQIGVNLVIALRG